MREPSFQALIQKYASLRTSMETADDPRKRCLCVQKKHKSLSTRQESGRARNGDFCAPSIYHQQNKDRCMLRCPLLLLLMFCLLLPKSPSYDCISHVWRCAITPAAHCGRAPGFKYRARMHVSRDCVHNLTCVTTDVAVKGNARQLRTPTTRR